MVQDELLYDREIKTLEEDLTPEHKKILSWIGKGKKVLEVACHTGYFSAQAQDAHPQVEGKFENK